MRASDYLQEVLWSFQKQKLRTALTSTGIAIGAFAITIMVGLGQGVQSYIELQVLSFGNPKVVMVFPDRARSAEKVLDQLTKIGKPAEKLDRLDEEARRERRGGLWISPEQVDKLRAIDGVAQVAPLTWLEMDGIALVPELPVALLDAPPRVVSGSALPTATADPQMAGMERLIAMAMGARGGPPGASTGSSAESVKPDVAPAPWVDPEVKARALALIAEAQFYQTDFAALATHPLAGAPSAGRLPREDAPEEIALSAQYAESFKLRPDELIGRTVVLRVAKLASVQQRFLFRDPTKYRDEQRYFRARVTGLAERSPVSRAIYASLALGREMARYQSQNPEILSDQKIGFQAHVRIAEGADDAKVKAEIRAIGLVAKSVDEQLADVTRSFLVVKLALSLFGLIAVFVATLGIANTLLMAITERTREIGVMKALGATEGTIRAMFATEAAAIGFVGGAVGSLSAIALGMVLNVFARRFLEADTFAGFSAFVFPPWLVLGAIAFSALVGALAGIYPANRAARLDPIEALRHE